MAAEVVSARYLNVSLLVIKQQDLDTDIFNIANLPHNGWHKAVVAEIFTQICVRAFLFHCWELQHP